MLRYETPRWSANVAYDSLRGGPGAFGGLSSGALRDDRLTVNGYVLVANAKLGAGWIRRDNRASSTPRSDLWYGGVSYPVTAAFSVDAEAFYLRFHDSSNKAWLFAARGVYAFTKRTSVYGTVGYIDNRGTSSYSVSSAAVGANPTPGGNQLGAMVGMKTVF